MVKLRLKANFWVRRRSHFILLIVGAVVILLLFFNEETSLSRNMEYQKEINRINEEIKLNRDSARFYKEKAQAILSGSDELEHMARERFHMQRTSEDVFLVDED